MKKSAAKSKKSNAPQVDPYLDALMNKFMERFAALERKMDAVMSAVAAASSGRSSGGHDSRAHDSRAHQEQNLQARERVARRERILFEAICADCNAPCEVPFRPTEGRAIYCKECWAVRRSSGNTGNTSSPQAPRPTHAPAAVHASASPQPATLVQNPGTGAKSKKKQPAKKSKKK